MIGKFKLVGLMVVAIMAVSAVAASAASAASFNSEVENTHITGHYESSSEKQTFTVSGFSVECTSIHAEGDITGAKSVSSVTVTPEYGGCEFFEEAASVTNEGCSYTFQATGGVSVGCEAGKYIRVATSACTMYIGSQNETSGGASYETVGSGNSREVDVNASVGNIHVAKKEGSLCFLLGSTGSYSGRATTAGSSGGEQVGIFYEA